MKNVHLIATDKPSRLICNVKGFCQITENFTQNDLDFISAKFYSIYITDNSEIKVGDWVITNNGLLAKVITELAWHFINSKKIILTTDQDLIKDGIQAIDDEFLEWFVKNPSCEFIEVVNDTLTVGEMSKLPLGTRNHKYKIIIPSDEDKHTCRYSKEFNQPHPRLCIICGKKEELKQETLEEAAEYYVKMQYHMGVEKEYPINDFIQGAKWQQEQNDTSKVTRVEVIQHSPPYNGRAFTKYNAKDVEIQFQDDGRTLKIFLK
jgi:hypothetical protein